MKNYYYFLWADAVQKIQHYQLGESRWKFISFCFITFMNTLNIACIDSWLSILGIYNAPAIYIDLFSVKALNEFISFIITYGLIFIILNYFLIFFRDRYKKIVQKYPMEKKNYTMLYICLSVLISIITLTIYSLMGLSKTIYKVF